MTTAPAPATATFEVHPTQRAKAAERVNALYARAEKVGAEVSVTFEDYDVVDEKSGAVAVWLRLHVTFTPLVLAGGWKAVAAWDITPGGVVPTALPAAEPGVIARSKERALSGECDHCNTTRNRRFVFVASNDEGAEVVIGSACAVDFFGTNPSRLLGWLGWADSLRDLDEDTGLGGGGGGPITVRPVDFLAATRAVVRVTGYTSKSKAWDNGAQPTANVVMDYLFNTSPACNEFRQQVGAPTDEDKQVAADVVAYFSEDQPADNDYLTSLNILLTQDRVSVYRAAGYIASALAAYQRETVKREAKAAASPLPVNGERITVIGTLLSMREQESQYGITLKGLVQHADGWKVWGTLPKGVRDEANVGDTVRFDAKVEPSRDDATFGFFSRPTKASVLADASA